MAEPHAGIAAVTWNSRHPQVVPRKRAQSVGHAPRRRVLEPSPGGGIPHLVFTEVHYSLISMVVGVDAKPTTGFGQQSWSWHGP